MVQEAKRMQGYGSDFIKEMFAAAKNPDMISFAGGAPAPELYALEAFRAASDKAFEVLAQNDVDDAGNCIRSINS